MTEITATVCRPKQEQSWLTAPGIQRVEKIPLERAIEEVFKIPPKSITDKHRRIDKIYAKHLYRLILERLLENNHLAGMDFKRISGKFSASPFKYTGEELEAICNCDRCSVFYSANVARNLIETDKTYRAKAQTIFDRITNNQIILP